MSRSNVPMVRDFNAHVTNVAQEALAKLLGPKNPQMQKAAGRVALAIQEAAGSNPKIMECRPESVAVCVAKCAVHNLMPGGPMPEVYLIPRKGELQWQIGHWGYLKLAERDGVRVEAHLVFDGDFFKVTLGTTPDLKHEPAFDEESWENLTHAYVVATSPDGTQRFAVLTKKRIKMRKEAAQTDKFWRKWWYEMSLKTIIKYGASRGVFRVAGDSQIAKAYEAENQDIDRVEDALGGDEDPFVTLLADMRAGSYQQAREMLVGLYRTDGDRALREFAVFATGDDVSGEGSIADVGGAVLNVTHPEEHAARTAQKQAPEPAADEAPEVIDVPADPPPSQFPQEGRPDDPDQHDNGEEAQLYDDAFNRM